LTTEKDFRALSQEEIQQLVAQGCSVLNDDWSMVQVSQEFSAQHVQHCRFSGPVRLGNLNGATCGDDPREAGIWNATLANCQVGDHVRIANVGVRIANYVIQDGACIENVGTLEARSGAKFGNGVEIEVLNEGGGREVILFNELSSQFAHLLCLHRYRPQLVARLQEFAKQAAAEAHLDQGIIGAGAVIRSVPEIVDVHIGPSAVVNSATSLVNGTVLSDSTAATLIGPGVVAKDFIVAEGAKVTGGAMVTTTYVGQASQVGRQFSAEGSLFFANCEAFHGEACSVFAGPYTVTHHKSSLLIAGMFSFYNAGSGTNQSNHMYKLGPIHEGRLERGSKTGSFSYMMWPCLVGPFSVVLGKHTRAFDTSDFPFSHIEALPDGRCSLIPGFNLTTVGTVRDGAKWPKRDRRSSQVRRDRLSFDVFSPYTVGRMLRGMAILKEKQQVTDRSVSSVAIGGAEVKRVFLRTGQKYFRRGCSMYLCERIVSHVEAALAEGATSVEEALQVDPKAVYSDRWVDIGGQLMPADRLEAFLQGIESGEIHDLAAFNAALDQIGTCYALDEWAWVKQAYRQMTGVDLEQADAQTLIDVADNLLASRTEFLEAVLVDAVKEFDPLSRIGFGTDGSKAAIEADFRAVRGEYDTNSFVVEMHGEIEQLKQRVANFQQRLNAS
jgi:hypothetical protein